MSKNTRRDFIKQAALGTAAFMAYPTARVLGANERVRLAMIGAGGDMRVFWSNVLVGSITTLALILLFWPLIASVFERVQSAFARDMKPDV